MIDILPLYIMPEGWGTPLEIQTLRYFPAMTREENVARATEQLHVTQLTLSKQMESLERELGNTLFTRRSFSIAPTGEGRLPRRRVEGLVAVADRTIGESLRPDDVLDGDLCLGPAEFHQVRFLIRKIKHLKEDRLGMRYHITSGNTEQTTEKLGKGLLDFVAFVEEPDAARCKTLNLSEASRWGIVTHADNELARKTRVSVSDLERLPLFCSEQSWVTGPPQWAGARMTELYLEGTFWPTYNGSAFVREGLGHLLIFARLVDTDGDSSLVFRPLWPILGSPMYLIQHRQQILSPTARRFLAQVDTTLKEENTSTDRHWSLPLMVKYDGNRLHASNTMTSTPEGTIT